MPSFSGTRCTLPRCDLQERQLRKGTEHFWKTKWNVLTESNGTLKTRRKLVFINPFISWNHIFLDGDVANLWGGLAKVFLESRLAEAIEMFRLASQAKGAPDSHLLRYRWKSQDIYLANNAHPQWDVPCCFPVLCWCTPGKLYFFSHKYWARQRKRDHSVQDFILYSQKTFRATCLELPRAHVSAWVLARVPHLRHMGERCATTCFVGRLFIIGHDWPNCTSRSS